MDAPPGSTATDMFVFLTSCPEWSYISAGLLSMDESALQHVDPQTGHVLTAWHGRCWRWSVLGGGVSQPCNQGDGGVTSEAPGSTVLSDDRSAVIADGR